MTDADHPRTDPVLSSAGYLLLKAGNYIKLEIEEALAELELSARELLVLSFVGSTPGLSQQDLSNRLGLDPTIIVGLLDGLESRDILTRARDPEDRRRNIIELTPTGQDLRTATQSSMAEAQDRFLAALDHVERETLQALLTTTLLPRLAWLRDINGAPGLDETA